MATFTGQAATNNTFTGTAGADLFLWAAADLTNLDRASGAGGADVLRLTSAGAAGVAGVAGIERFQLAAGGNAITLANGNFTGVTGAVIVVSGGAGANTVNGAALTGANRIDVTAGAGADVLRGGAGADVFRFAAGSLAGDTVAGGLGRDLLLLTTSGGLGTNGLNGTAGVERFVLAAGGNTLSLTNAQFAGVAGAVIVVSGGAGADTVNAGALTGANRIDVTAGAGIGADTLTGGRGTDVFRFTATGLTSADRVAGGLGRDLLLLTSTGTVAPTGLNNVAGVERIGLAAGGNAITLVNGNFAGVAGAAIVVTGSAGADTVNAADVTGAKRIDVTAGLGADTLTGGAGRDVFRFAAASMAGDTVQGGGGLDLLLLTSGSGLGTGGLNGMAGVERIVLSASGNTFALVDGNLAGVAGSRIVVSGGAGADIVNGGALTGVNAVDVTAGLGADRLTGGAGRDIFRFRSTDITSADTVIGGAGLDLLLLTTSGTVAGLNGVSGVETIELATSGSNSITLGDANFANVAGGRIAVNGFNGNDTVNGSGLTGANFIDVTAGGGDDTLRGGAGADVFRFAEADLDGDIVAGGGGADTLLLTTVGALGGTALANVTGVETIRFAVGGNALALVDANFAGVESGIITVIGGGGPNLVDAGQLNDGRIDVTAGKDSDNLIGGASADVFRFAAVDLTALDAVDGGAGYDTLFLTTTGTVGSLAGLSGFEEIVLATDGNAITLADGNTTAGGGSIRIRGSAGDDTVNASAFTAFSSINVTAGAGDDALRGGAGSDDFRFGHDQLTAADTVAGGDGYDELRIETAGALAVDALANVTGIEAIYLATGNTLKIADANFAVPLSEISNQIAIRLTGESSSIDGSAVQTATNGLYVYDNGGIDAVIGGAGVDVLDLRGGVFVAGDTFDGGGEVDTILFDRSMDLLGTSISNVERLLIADPSGPTTVNISGENAAGFTRFGSESLNGVTDTFNILLSEGSTTNLANLGMLNREVDDPFTGLNEGDAINVSSSGGTTAVTLSGAISRFTGSADNDTVGLAFFIGRYRNDVVINGGGGDDRIAWDDNLLSGVLNGGVGTDTLVMSNGSTINLESGTGPRFVIDFENIDASASTAAVNLTGRDSFRSVLTGGNGGDTITAGAAGAVISGGLGVDTLTGGSGDDLFRIRSDDEAAEDTIDGGAGSDGIDLFASADLTDASISGIETLFLAAATAQGAFTNDAVTATVLSSQLTQLSGGIFGNGYFTDSVETLVVNVGEGGVDLTNLAFSYWRSEDKVVINGTAADDIIIGTSQNDVIAGASGGGDTLSGGGGNDVIGYDAGLSGDLDGGEGIDTVRLDSFFESGTLEMLHVDLAAGRINEVPVTGSPTGLNATGFENADFSANLRSTTMIGTVFDNTLIGGSAADTITGGLGADTLTGNGGADSFVWNDKIEGSDTITDFERGTDKLVFNTARFGFTSASFETVVVENGSSTDFSNADLILTTASLTVAQATAFLATDAFVNRPIFLIARGENFQNILYYSANPSTSTVEMIADLGFGGSPITFGLGDFVFI